MDSPGPEVGALDLSAQGALEPWLWAFTKPGCEEVGHRGDVTIRSENGDPRGFRTARTAAERAHGPAPSRRSGVRRAPLPDGRGGLLPRRLFAAAALTDQVDGFLARRWHVESEFGKFADPLADRLMIDAAVLLLCLDGRLPWLALAIVLGRDAS